MSSATTKHLPLSIATYDADDAFQDLLSISIVRGMSILMSNLLVKLCDMSDI